jgi:hypothetical protein
MSGPPGDEEDFEFAAAMVDGQCTSGIKSSISLTSLREKSTKSGSCNKKPLQESGAEGKSSSPLLSLLRKTRKVKIKGSLDELLVDSNGSSADLSILPKLMNASAEGSDSINSSFGSVDRVPLEIVTLAKQSSNSPELQKSAQYSQKGKGKSQVRSPWLHRLFKNQKRKSEIETTPEQNATSPIASPTSISTPNSRVRYSHISVDSRPNLDEILSDISKFFPGIKELEVNQVIEDSKSKQCISFRNNSYFESPLHEFPDSFDTRNSSGMINVITYIFLGNSSTLGIPLNNSGNLTSFRNFEVIIKQKPAYKLDPMQEFSCESSPIECRSSRFSKVSGTSLSSGHLSSIGERVKMTASIRDRRDSSKISNRKMSCSPMKGNFPSPMKSNFPSSMKYNAPSRLSSIPLNEYEIKDGRPSDLKTMELLHEVQSTTSSNAPDSAFWSPSKNELGSPSKKANRTDRSTSSVGMNFPIVAEEEPLQQAQSCLESEKKFHWFKGDCIGAGAFAKVFLGLNLDTWELMAVKQVNRKKIQRSAPKHQDIGLLTPEEAIRMEIELMKDLDDVNIVKFFDYEITDEQINIFMEYIPGGSVAGLLSKSGPFPERLCQSISFQLINGLCYLHSGGVIHRDIKTANG